MGVGPPYQERKTPAWAESEVPVDTHGQAAHFSKGRFYRRGRIYA